MYRHLFLISFLLLAGLPTTIAQGEGPAEPKLMDKKLEITGQWFLAFQQKHNDGSEVKNSFVLKRGYITFSKDLNQNFSLRFTQDIITDEEGDDAGNIEMRLKYCYLKYAPSKVGIFRNSFFEVGMVHRPYLDFEEKINRYRLQGTMFLERYKVISSADFGITFFSLLGGKLDSEYTNKVSSAYPGKYGSIALGVYNGGGYHALEINRNKTIEGRITARPFHRDLPGLQTTYAFVIGKGNSALNPDFNNHTFLLSYECRRLRSGFQYTFGKGNMGGDFLDALNRPTMVGGVSAFTELFIVKSTLATFLRYDHFTQGDAKDDRERMIGGLAWYFLNQNKVLFDVDILNRNTGIDRTFEVVVELLF